MAPEQIMGVRLFPSTDLYALAGVLYEMFTGGYLFGRQLGVQPLAHHHMHVTPEPLTAAPPPIADVVMRTLAKDPTARFVDAREFAIALARASARAFGPSWLSQSAVRIQVEDDIRDAAHDTSFAPKPSFLTPPPAHPLTPIPTSHTPPAQTPPATPNPARPQPPGVATPPPGAYPVGPFPGARAGQGFPPPAPPRPLTGQVPPPGGFRVPTPAPGTPGPGWSGPAGGTPPPQVPMPQVPVPQVRPPQVPQGGFRGPVPAGWQGGPGQPGRPPVGPPPRQPGPPRRRSARACSGCRSGRPGSRRCWSSS
jgi:serine/threonine-protein kinase